MKKLKGNKIVSELFREGKKINLFPLQIIYLVSKENAWGVSVSKNLFHLAVHRNKVKRLLREGFKKNLLMHFNNFDKKYHFMILFHDNNIPSFDKLNSDFKKLANKTINILSK